jgi:MoaA/NifB/PqqE/SkfB family radical SAM enzyme
VTISTHHQFCDPEHVRNVADLLYEKNVIVNSIVLMDPNEWDKCMDIVESLKQSKHKWSIRYSEIIHNTINYTDEQKKIFKKLRARGSNLWWYFKNNKSYRSKVKVTDINGKKHTIGDEGIILQRLNNFKDWECTVGVNWIAVKADGTVSGICGNGLFKNHEKYNIFNDDFIEKFNPVIETTICTQDACWCLYETNMDKRKIIPIKSIT